MGPQKIATRLSSGELSSLIESFLQEITKWFQNAIFVLKYTGNAVISYFPNVDNPINPTENAVQCGYAKNDAIKNSMNITFQDFSPSSNSN